MEKEKVFQGIEKLLDSGLEEYFFGYVKIIFFYFVLPMGLCILINEGSVLLKLIQWWQQDFAFWTDTKSLLPTIILILSPLVYAYWLYHKTIQEELFQIHEDFLVKLFKEVSDVASTKILDWYANRKTVEDKFNIEEIWLWINTKISRLPKVLNWLVKKVINQIPIVDIVLSYDTKHLDTGNHAAISANIEEKINAVALEIIENIVPEQCKYILRANILLLMGYFAL